MLKAVRDPTRQVSLRLPDALLRQAKAVAKRRGMSLNALLRHALVRMAIEERETVLRESYDALGADPESEVEPFLPAQAEVVRRGR